MHIHDADQALDGNVVLNLIDVTVAYEKKNWSTLQRTCFILFYPHPYPCCKYLRIYFTFGDLNIVRLNDK